MDSNNIKKWSIIIITIILLAVMGISTGGRNNITKLENAVGMVITPIQEVFYSIGESISDFFEPFFNVWDLTEKNEILTRENELLKEEVVKVTLSNKELKELRDLQSALKYTDQLGSKDYVTSDVISKDAGNWYNTFTINAGTNDGITKYSTVVNGSGLIGMVYEVGSTWSKVVSVIDHKSSIGFQTLTVEEDQFGQIDGTSDGSLIGYFYDPEVEIEIGTEIVTSGLGVYPKGILIGTITEVSEDKNNLLVEIVVEPAVNFRKLSKVMVIPYHGSGVEN